MLGQEVVDLVLARLPPFEPLLEERVEVADHLAIRLEVLRRRALDRLGQALDEAVERLAAQPIRQRREPIPRRGLHEVVFLERADPATDVPRQRLELVEPAGGGVAQHRAELLVHRGPVGRRRPPSSSRRSMPARSSATISSSSCLTSASDVAQLIALLELLAPPAEALAEVVEAVEVGAGRVAAAPAAFHQPPERLAEVAFGHDVVGEGVHDLVGVEGRDRLAAVPASVAGGPGEERVARRSGGGSAVEVVPVRDVRRHRGRPPAGVPAIIAGRPCLSPPGPC